VFEELIFEKMCFKFIYYINFINLIFCVYKYIPDSCKFYCKMHLFIKINCLIIKLDPRRSGLTPDFGFNYEPRSSKRFPEFFTINSTLLGTSLYKSL